MGYIDIDETTGEISVHYIDSETFKKIKKKYPGGYDHGEITEWVCVGNVTFYKKGR